MAAIWDAKIHKEKKTELPAIIPIVFYQGSSEWKVNNSLGALISGYEDIPLEVKKYIPGFEYLIYNISKYKDEEIMGHAYLQVYLTIVGSIYKGPKEFLSAVSKAMGYLRELSNQKDVIGYFKTVIRYIFSARDVMTKKEHEKIIKEIEIAYPEGMEIALISKLTGLSEAEIKRLADS